MAEIPKTGGIKRMKSCRQLIVLLFLIATLTVPVIAREAFVITEPLQKKEFIWRLPLQGSVESAHEAKVSPRIPGPIEAIFVKEGDRVEAGITCLFQIDSMKLQKNVEIRKQEMEVARYSLKEKQTRLKQAQADLEKAQMDMTRVRLMWEDNSTSKDNLEKAQLKYRVSELSVEHAQAIIDLAGEQFKQAELAVKIAEKDYADSRVFAPMNGIVVSRMQEAGEMAAPGKPILVIKDPDHIEVVAHLPADYYHSVITGSTTALISTSGEDSAEAIISFKSPVINPALRTFQIKCQYPGRATRMIPGELANIVVVLSRRQGHAVPDSAILNRDGHRVIFTAESGKARMIKVECGLENDGMTEIFSDQLKPETKVIVRGQNMLEEGQAISIRNGGR